MRSALLVAILCVAAFGQSPQRAVTDPGVVTTRQAITPAGVTSIFQGRIYGAAWDATGTRLWLLHASDVIGLDWKTNNVASRVPHGGTPGAQAIATEPGTGRVLFANSTRRA